MRATVSAHLKRPELDREKVMACVLRILSTCFFRPGSQAYASETGGIGIATLRPKHVAVRSGTVFFDFPGKSGKRQRREIRDPADRSDRLGVEEGRRSRPLPVS
jgi:DNA topoisomerase-1